MSADRELLELAAKAAGIVVRWHEQSHYGPTMEIMEGEEGGPPWNPLTDDGDALRLAERLRFTLAFSEWEVDVEGERVMDGERFSGHDSRLPTMRRCIVRAAAAIGKAMP